MLVVVEISEPTVSCDEVAMRAVPAALLVIIEFGAKDVDPVPPYSTPIEVVAPTTPLFAWSGPFRLPARVSTPAFEKDDVAVAPKYAV